MALKLATGAGKTTVMAMPIAFAFNDEAHATDFNKVGIVPASIHAHAAPIRYDSK